jgi:hypothetical protein
MFSIASSDTNIAQIRSQRIASSWIPPKTVSVSRPSSSNPSISPRPTFTTLRWSYPPFHRSSESCTTAGATGSLGFREWRLEPQTHGTPLYLFLARMITTSALGPHAAGSLLRRRKKRSKSGIISPSNYSQSSNPLEKPPLANPQVRWSIPPMVNSSPSASLRLL